MGEKNLGDFDARALYRALDERRRERSLSWNGVAKEMWDLSADLNARRDDHPISPSTLTAMNARGTTTCQHALFMLRWLGAAPEDYVTGVAVGEQHALPDAGPEHRLRWSLERLYQALDDQRRNLDLTWREAAVEIRCTPNQLTGIRTARYAIEIRLAMRIVGWLGRPAADFVYAADW